MTARWVRVAAPLLWASGWLKGLPGVDLRMAVTILGSLFLVGLVGDDLHGLDGADLGHVVA